MCEYVLPDKLAGSGACRAGSFPIPINRVHPPQEVLRTAYGDSPCGNHNMCEHLLSGKLIFSAACGTGSSLIPINRVHPPQERTG